MKFTPLLFFVLLVSMVPACREQKSEQQSQIDKIEEITELTTQHDSSDDEAYADVETWISGKSTYCQKHQCALTTVRGTMPHEDTRVSPDRRYLDFVEANKSEFPHVAPWFFDTRPYEEKSRRVRAKASYCLQCQSDAREKYKPHLKNQENRKNDDSSSEADSTPKSKKEQ